MNKREIKAWLKEEMPRMKSCTDIDGNRIKSIYLGSCMSLDPCGRYHHTISPNGATSKCERFWENMETVATDLNGWIEGGESDPTDIYFCANDETEETSE